MAKSRDLWMAFVDLEKAFDRVPREVVLWALTNVSPVSGPSERISALEVGVAIGRMKQGKSVGPKGVAAEIHLGVDEWIVSVIKAMYETLINLLSFAQDSRNPI